MGTPMVRHAGNFADRRRAGWSRLYMPPRGRSRPGSTPGAFGGPPTVGSRPRPGYEQPLPAPSDFNRETGDHERR